MRAHGEPIRKKKSRLRGRIANDPALQRDFDFLVSRTRWPEESLLARLFWDCNMMTADPKSVLAREKKRNWPISEPDLHRAIKGILKVAGQVEEVNQTEFSPARTVFFYDEEDEMLTERQAKRRRAAAAGLPSTLRFYASELRRKVSISAGFWRLQKPDIVPLVRMVRESSLYESIRLATGSYHQTRLHRLVNAARIDQGLGPIEQRAFTIWLNRLRKRHQPTQAESAPARVQANHRNLAC
jgi:hypothetical protein